MDRYFDDIDVGMTERFGQYEVTREEVLDFAGKYDPQPFHLSDEAAEKTLFGRLAASGFHTAAMSMRMMVDHWQATGTDKANMGGIGMDELRWLKPVYPGDTLYCTVKLIEKIPSRSKPDRGVVKYEWTTYNQHDEPVMRQISLGMLKRKTG